MRLNHPIRTNRGNYKFKVRARDRFTGEVKTVYFGDKRYQDYRQHKSLKRRKSYNLRSASIRDKYGRLTKSNPGSANYWSRKYLWKLR